ncbi:MAG: hypothetical protein WAT79_08800 [Saprospiraceae bacterium]
MKTEYLTEDPEWVSFYPNFNSSFYIEKAGYFDERPVIHTSITQLLVLLLLPALCVVFGWFLILFPFIFFGWGKLYIHLPIKTGIQDCDSAAWGFNYHDNTIWIYVGGGGNFEGGKKWITFTMPWNLEWYRTSLLLKDQKSWEHSNNKKRESFYEDKWKDPNLVFIETHPYVDKYDNTTVNATITVEEREWRPKWFMWTSLFSTVRKSISIDFDNEVGKKKGSWKGGTIGCGYDIKKGETPLECLKRMEIERSF